MRLPRLKAGSGLDCGRTAVTLIWTGLVYDRLFLPCLQCARLTRHKPVWYPENRCVCQYLESEVFIESNVHILVGFQICNGAPGIHVGAKPGQHAFSDPLSLKVRINGDWSEVPVRLGQVAPRPFTDPVQHSHRCSERISEAYRRKYPQLFDRRGLALAWWRLDVDSYQCVVEKPTKDGSTIQRTAQHRFEEPCEGAAAMFGVRTECLDMKWVVAHAARKQLGCETEFGGSEFAYHGQMGTAAVVPSWDRRGERAVKTLDRRGRGGHSRLTTRLCAVKK
jgi:hypothetical protein